MKEYLREVHDERMRDHLREAQQRLSDILTEFDASRLLHAEREIEELEFDLRRVHLLLQQIEPWSPERESVLSANVDDHRRRPDTFATYSNPIRKDIR